MSTFFGTVPKKCLLFDFKMQVKYNETAMEKEIKELYDAAKAVKERAYAPYSKFYVGAAILLDNGQIIPGSNQENASYPLCMCAERVALYSAITQYPNAKALKLAVVANNPKQNVDKPIPPCGACRQVLMEVCGPDLEVVMSNIDNEIRILKLKELLPLSFNKDFLDK